MTTSDQEIHAKRIEEGTEMAQSKNWKARKKDNGPTGKKLLEDIAEKKLTAVWTEEGIWLPLEADVAKLVERAGFGSRMGKGDAAKEHVQTLLSCDEKETYSWVASVLRIGAEEAFFLAHALQCLVMHRNTMKGETMGIEECWMKFVQEREQYATSYVAYSHFRSKGWLPKSGIQYGSDLVLYRNHPSVAHSEYAVIVLPMSEELGAPAGRKAFTTWNDLQTLSRLSVQVKKGLLVLYVHVEKGTDCSTPSCLEKFSVQELQLSRWNSEKD